jgi:hypothetical protein
MEILIKVNQLGDDCLVEIVNDNKSDTHALTQYANVKDKGYTLFGSNDSPEQEHEETVVTKQRDIHTFMRGNEQYIKVGAVCAKIMPDDTLHTISKSCYYNNRNKDRNGQK